MKPDEAKALLLRVVTKLVGQKLEQGGFIPFGAILGQKRDMQLLIPESVKRNVSTEELDRYWIQTIREATANGDYTTVCWCADVRRQASDGTLIPALFIHAEHAHSFSEDILIPYRNEAGRIVFDDPNSEPTPHQIFTIPA